MNTELKIISESVNPQTTIFHLHGWLDAQSEERLVTAMQETKEQGTERLILDFEEISMLTSAGIRSIQKAQKIFAKSNQDVSNIKLCNAPPNVYHVLKMTGILHILPMYESLQAALDA
jgi:anti-sigma B factor antagonist